MIIYTAVERILDICSLQTAAPNGAKVCTHTKYANRRIYGESSVHIRSSPLYEYNDTCQTIKATGLNAKVQHTHHQYCFTYTHFFVSHWVRFPPEAICFFFHSATVPRKAMTETSEPYSSLVKPLYLAVWDRC